MYQHCFKRLLDIVLSLLAMIFLSWLLLLLAIVIMIDDPGPILFSQKRVGKHKKYFRLHKFRSMKRNAPHDVPCDLIRAFGAINTILKLKLSI